MSSRKKKYTKSTREMLYEIRVLKKLARAQAKMINHYKDGGGELPLKVYEDILLAEKYYEVIKVSQIQ